MLQIIRRSFETQGLSDEVIKIILGAWRQGTVKQYNTTLLKWTVFCQEREKEIFITNIGEVLEFLNKLTKEDLSYSAINSARSALSAFVQLEGAGSIPIGSHPLVSKFMKGLFNLRPPKPRYTHIWEVGPVLDLLRSWSPVKDLAMKTLTYKLTMLIALLAAPRGQTLKALRIDNMKIVGSDISFQIIDLLKTNRQGQKVGQEITLSAYPPDRRLCILTVLREYLNRTTELREGKQQLLLCHNKPYVEASKDTLARWVRATLGLAGVDTTTFKAHSVRSASSSAALNASVPVADILDRVKWRSECTFRKFYNKPVRKADIYQQAILNS